MRRVKISGNIYTDYKQIRRLFGDLINDIDEITQSEFDDCINYAKEKDWQNWQSGFESWKEKGKIPFETIE